MKKNFNRKRLLFILIICLCVYTAGDLFSDWKRIYDNLNTKEELEKKESSLKEEQEKLEKEVTKLQDEDYVLRYAREKYSYTKEGELIISIKK